MSVSIRVRSRERTIIVIRCLCRVILVSIRVRSRERTITGLLPGNMGSMFQSASALASGRFRVVLPARLPDSFNPRPLSRADDDNFVFGNSIHDVSIRVRSRERTMRPVLVCFAIT